jgi:hypothetical protein
MWLMSSILQLEEGSVDLFSKNIKEDNLEINIDVVEKPKTIDVYVQAWHNQIFEPGFTGIFKGKDSYTMWEPEISFFRFRPQIGTTTGSLKFGNK